MNEHLDLPDKLKQAMAKYSISVHPNRRAIMLTGPPVGETGLWEALTDFLAEDTDETADAVS